MAISFVNPDEVPDTYNIMLYGPSGSGKSTGAASAPGPLLYLNADGPDGLRHPRKRYGHEKIREVTVDGAAVLNDVLLMLRGGVQGWGTVVLDTFSAAYTVLLEEKAKGGRATLPQYGDVSKSLERFCRELRDMPINFVVVCQEHAVKDESTGVIERVPHGGTSNPALINEVMRMMTVVGYCGRVAPREGQENPRYMATLVDAPGRRGKDRTDSLGAAADLNLSDWIAIAQAPIAMEVAA